MHVALFTMLPLFHPPHPFTLELFFPIGEGPGC
jgi:hypothetical protein